MTTYYTESFYRGQISDKITSIETCPFTIRVTKTPNKTVGLLTISPDTEFEEIVEYATTANPNELSITKRGINPSCTGLVTSGTDYNNTTYQKAHAIGDLVRGDVNHIHLNQIIDSVVGITPYSIYDAVVSSTGGNYTTLKDAIDGGKKNILIKGSVTETTTTSITLTQDVKIEFTSGASLTFIMTNDELFYGNFKLLIIGGTINVTGTTKITLGLLANLKVTNTIINLTSAAGIIYVLSESTSIGLNEYNGCTFNVTGASGNKQIVFDNSPCIYTNCRFNISSSATYGSAGNGSEFYNCYINFSNGDIISKFEAFSGLLNGCTVIVSGIWWSDTSAIIDNSNITSNITGGNTALFRGQITNSTLVVPGNSEDIVVTGRCSNVLVEGGKKLTVDAGSTFVGGRWQSGVYTGTAQLWVLGGIFTGSTVNTQSTSAGTATVTGIFTNNICTDTAGTFSTSGAGVIANNQLS